jgi:hypothetical protein
VSVPGLVGRFPRPRHLSSTEPSASIDANQSAIARPISWGESLVEDLSDNNRAAILRRYLEFAPGARPFFPIDRRAPLTDFEHIVNQYPVFSGRVIDRRPAIDLSWRADPGDGITEVSAGLAPDGTVLLGTNGSQEWAYRPDGTLLWHSPRVITYSSPSVTATGLAYVGDHSGTMHVFRVRDGTQAAAYRVSPAQIWTAPVVDSSYRLYYGTQDGHAVGLNANGAKLFDIDLGAAVDSYPALTADANLIIGARNGTLSAIS